MDTIDCIRAFHSVAEAGSFTNAAKHLSVSTNLVSKRVSHLETRLGVRLLNRTTRKVALTESGQSYLQQSKALIDEFDRVENSISDSHAAPKGHLRIAAPTTFAERHLAPITANFLKMWPDVSVELSLTDRFIDLVAEGFDMAVRIGKLHDSTVIAKRLAETGLVICAAPSYLSQTETPRCLQDLAGHECIIDTNFRDPSHWPLSSDIDPIQMKVNGRLKLNSTEAAKQAAIEGFGIALCPAYAVVSDIKAGTLVPLLQDQVTASLGIYALYPSNKFVAGKVRIYIDFLSQYLSTTLDI